MDMTWYEALVLIHVIAAVVGLGPAFIFSIISRFPKTKEQLLWTNDLLSKLEKPVKIGSITLFITGLVMGVLNTHLFTAGWYIASIILYIVAQILVIGIAGKKSKKAAEILESFQGNDIPEEVTELNKKSDTALSLASIIAIVMIVLMSVKPF
ncbi:DUF2269 family protein [Bacillus sp. JJ1474]|uniref:DUF2269 family protein n=1 Tax=Bacillus sp. JJ1474 TaxID=3122955 RepID=UPI002FFE23ED